MRIIFTIIISLVSCFSFSQAEAIRSTTIQADSLPANNHILKDTSIYQLGFTPLSHQFAAPVMQLDQSHFNKGNISDPLQLIQGKLSGLLIARAGSDPNEPFVARIRGANSLYLSSSPLILIDGFLLLRCWELTLLIFKK